MFMYSCSACLPFVFVWTVRNLVVSNCEILTYLLFARNTKSLFFRIPRVCILFQKPTGMYAVCQFYWFLGSCFRWLYYYIVFLFKMLCFIFFFMIPFLYIIINCCRLSQYVLPVFHIRSYDTANKWMTVNYLI